MSKKQLDELLGLESFSPLKTEEGAKIKGGRVRIDINGPIQRILVREDRVQ